MRAPGLATLGRSPCQLLCRSGSLPIGNERKVPPVFEPTARGLRHLGGRLLGAFGKDFVDFGVGHDAPPLRDLH